MAKPELANHSITLEPGLKVWGNQESIAKVKELLNKPKRKTRAKKETDSEE
jgi:hypothetical protein